ncbi:hypothetical protein, partial [Kingella oralis]|uniref:hypothetical protein n=1 Tax=Kingella oralis TaxID=505 RepID=UPI002D7EBF92
IEPLLNGAWQSHTPYSCRVGITVFLFSGCLNARAIGSLKNKIARCSTYQPTPVAPLSAQACYNKHFRLPMFTKGSLKTWSAAKTYRPSLASLASSSP